MTRGREEGGGRKRALEMGDLEQELASVWAALDQEKGGESARSVLRTHTMNLLVVSTGMAAGLENLHQAIAGVSARHPCRAIIMQVAGGGTKPCLEGHVRALCHRAERSSQLVCGEQIDLSASETAAERMASIALGLLVPDLPVNLVWLLPPSLHAPYAKALIESADRLIVDSGLFSEPGRDLETLEVEAEALSAGLFLRDLAWARLSCWRRLTAGFFEDPEERPLLDRIVQVKVEYAEDGSGETHPFVAALAYQSWLAGRLKWKPAAGKLQPNGTGAFVLEVPSGERVSSKLVPSAAVAGALPGSLLSVSLETAGPRAANFSIKRLEGGTCLEALAEIGGKPPLRRVHEPRSESLAAVLTEELETRGEDAIYREALRASRAALAVV